LRRLGSTSALLLKYLFIDFLKRFVLAFRSLLGHLSDVCHIVLSPILHSPLSIAEHNWQPSVTFCRLSLSLSATVNWLLASNALLLLLFCFQVYGQWLCIRSLAAFSAPTVNFDQFGLLLLSSLSFPLTLFPTKWQLAAASGAFVSAILSSTNSVQQRNEKITSLTQILKNLFKGILSVKT